MQELIRCGRGVLCRVFSKQEKRKFRDLMNRYNAYGYVPFIPGARKRMDLVYCIGEDWCVLFTIHLINNFSLALKYRLDWNHTWFFRRVATVEECKDKYGNVTVEGYRCVIEYLKQHGAEAVLGLVMRTDKRRSGGTFKRLGFEEIGETVKGHGRWFLLRLNKNKE